MAPVRPTIVAERVVVAVRRVRVPVYVYPSSALGPSVSLLVCKWFEGATGGKGVRKAKIHLFYQRPASCDEILRVLRRLTRLAGLCLCKAMIASWVVEIGHRHEGVPSTRPSRG